MNHAQILRGFLSVLFVCSISVGINAQKAKHLVLITIDGFRPDFYMDESWGAVNMREMKENGVSALGVWPVFPTLTFPNHTSIITGVRPGKHGIIYNARFIPGQEYKELYWYSNQIKAPTLWQVLRDEGKLTAAVNWPVAAGNDVSYNIPIIKESGKQQYIVTAENSYPKGLMEEVELHATGKLDNNTYNTNKHYLIIDENVARISGYLIRKYRPTFTALRLSATDHFEHMEGRDGPMVRKAVAGADRAIRSIIESLQMAGIEDSTVIIVTGDHGFVNSHTALAPNIWLKEAGIESDKDKAGWKAHFIGAGGSAFLRLKDPDDEVLLRKIKNIIENRPAAERKLFRVIDKTTLDSLSVDPDAMLSLAAVQGIVFSTATSGPAVRKSGAGTHGYYPDFLEIQTGFIAMGPGLKKGLTIPVMEIIDIAPLIAELLGVELKSAEGILYRGMLE